MTRFGPYRLDPRYRLDAQPSGLLVAVTATPPPGQVLAEPALLLVLPDPGTPPAEPADLLDLLDAPLAYQPGGDAWPPLIA